MVTSCKFINSNPGDGLAVPRQLLLPVVLATLSQVAQWGIALSLGEVGASYCDPISCKGKAGKETYRLSLTSSQIMVPIGSVMSSVMPCPRWGFYALSAVQLAAGSIIACAAFGTLGWAKVWVPITTVVLMADLK